MKIYSRTMKGSIDIMTGIAFFTILIISVWVLTVIFQDGVFAQSGLFNHAVQQSPQAANVVSNANKFFTGLNTVIAFAYIFFAIGAVIAAAFTESNPVFAAIGIIILPIELVLSFGFHDAFFTIIQTSAFGALAVQYPFVTLTFEYLPVITFIMWVIVTIVTFAR